MAEHLRALGVMLVCGLLSVQMMGRCGLCVSETIIELY